MGYRVVVMLPAKDQPGSFEASFSELRYSTKRQFIWFGRRYIDVSIAFGDGYEIKPLERKEDADVTAQVVYLAMRRLGAEVKVEECD